MTVQFLEIAGQRVAVLPAADYERLVDAAEDRADGDAADGAAARRDAGEEYVPASLLDRIISGESALRVWREHRGLTGAALAKKADVDPATIAKLELGHGRPRIHLALTRSALGVAPVDIMPDV